jgi:AraC-like DNA-binding protein
MEDYNRIIESLSVRFIKAKNINILNAVTIKNNYDVENSLVLLNSGQIRFGKEQTPVHEGQILFIPGGKQVTITYGASSPQILSKDDFINNREVYLQSVDKLPQAGESYSYVSFEVKVFDSVSFFASLDIPPFIIDGSEPLRKIIYQITLENVSKKPGRSRIIKLLVEQLTIELIRYIVDKKLFLEQFATNSTYFKDPRLIDIFTFIKENLNQDLSNKVLANVANVSEDYVGQYFKMLTGINPQDYIEYQRMEMAVNLLRTSKKSIREIGKDVGYKDTAYFCRRFKMMFGIPAGKMRRRESLINV